MSSPKGRWIALSTGAVAAISIAVAVYLLRDDILWWWRTQAIGEDFIQADEGSDGRLLLTFRVRDADGNSVARRIGDLARVRVIPDPDIRERVSTGGRCMPWRCALEMIAGEMSCTVVEDGGVLRICGQACNMPIAFEDADLAVVLRLLAGRLGRTIELPADLRGRVTGNPACRSRGDVRAAIESIAAMHGLRLAWPDPGSSAPITVRAR